MFLYNVSEGSNISMIKIIVCCMRIRLIPEAFCWNVGFSALLHFQLKDIDWSIGDWLLEERRSSFSLASINPMFNLWELWAAKKSIIIYYVDEKPVLTTVINKIITWIKDINGFIRPIQLLSFSTTEIYEIHSRQNKENLPNLQEVGCLVIMSLSNLTSMMDQLLVILGFDLVVGAY